MTAVRTVHPRLREVVSAFERALAEPQNLLRRLALYGGAVMVLAGGWKVKTALELRALVYDQPYEQVTVFEGELGAESFREGLEESGSDAAEIKAVVAAVKRFGGTGREHRGDSFRIVRATDGALRHVTLRRGKKRIVVASQDGKLSATAADPQVVTRPRTARGVLRGNLWLSMTREGVPVEVIQEFADVFQWSVDFLTEPRDGDRYAVTWSEDRTPDGRIWGREVLAGIYDGRAAGRAVGVLFEGDFFDQKGDALESLFLRAPLNYRRISSTFSRGRYHPILRKVRPHHGIDYAAGRGTPVVTVGSGRVVFAGRKGGYGNVVEVKHPADYLTRYGHLNSISVRAGANVRQGQLIGTVGSTGLATGPHLHFEITQRGGWINFLSLKAQRARQVAKAKREAFQSLLAKRLSALEGDAAAAAR
ncbi:MAG: metalloendopeptidase-like membrane protein [Elusimicrobia bacterium]|nr:MAG: metalloendopeptidase-like membrane protein [Elusimicrobiota bacterium]